MIITKPTIHYYINYKICIVPYRHIKSSPASCLSGVRTTVASLNEFNSLTASL